MRVRRIGRQTGGLLRRGGPQRTKMCRGKGGSLALTIYPLSNQLTSLTTTRSFADTITRSEMFILD